MKSFIALLKIDLKLASRNRAVLFFNYLFPLAFFFIFAQMFDARQGAAILQVVSMVIVLGILGNGLFGAGMRAVQEREENVLRRYKVTPITPVPLLAASMITGVILYVPSVVIILFLAHQFYGMAVPGQLVSLLVFVCLRCDRFSLVRPDYRRSRQFLSGKQHPHPADLHGDAFPERRDHSAHLHAALVAKYYPVHSRDLSDDRDRWHHAARRIAACKLAGGRSAPCYHRGRDLHRHEVIPLGEGGKIARLSQALGAGGTPAVSFPRLPTRRGVSTIWSRHASWRAISAAVRPG